MASFYSEYLERSIMVFVEDDMVYGVTLGSQRPKNGTRTMKVATTAASNACQSYLAGEDIDLNAYPVSLRSGSAFAQAVLRAVREIPRGHVTTYSALAATIGRPQSARAVGNVLSKNPIPLFIACHRVVRKSSIGGFSCGVDLKQRLLQLEGVQF